MWGRPGVDSSKMINNFPVRGSVITCDAPQPNVFSHTHGDCRQVGQEWRSWPSATATVLPNSEVAKHVPFLRFRHWLGRWEKRMEPEAWGVAGIATRCEPSHSSYSLKLKPHFPSSPILTLSTHHTYAQNASLFGCQYILNNENTTISRTSGSCTRPLCR